MPSSKAFASISTTRPDRGAITKIRAKHQIFIASTGFSIIRGISKEELNRNYLFYILRQSHSLAQMGQRSSGGNYPAITQGELSNILIPLPKPKVQAQIVTKMDTAYAAKKQKEMEAKALLDGIDDYLLCELGIKFPETDENTIQNRIFNRKLSQMSGERIDPKYHKNINFILSQITKYPIRQFSDLILGAPQYGANEIAINCEVFANTRYIRITDIDELGNLKENNWKTTQKIEEKYILEKNDLLFARSGSVGRAYLHNKVDYPAIFAGYLIRFKLNKKLVIPEYIFYFCHSVIYKLWVDTIQRQAVQSNINSYEYKTLPIVLPKILQQKRIVNHISNIRNQAKKLLQKAKVELDQTKEEIETLILEGD